MSITLPGRRKKAPRRNLALYQRILAWADGASQERALAGVTWNQQTWVTTSGYWCPCPVHGGRVTGTCVAGAALLLTGTSRQDLMTMSGTEIFSRAAAALGLTGPEAEQVFAAGRTREELHVIAAALRQARVVPARLLAVLRSADTGERAGSGEAAEPDKVPDYPPDELRRAAPAEPARVPEPVPA